MADVSRLGLQLPTPDPGWQRVENDLAANCLTYGGSGWTINAASTDCSNGSYSATNVVGSYLVFNFTGTKFRWIPSLWASQRTNDPNAITLTIDGKPYNFSEYATSNAKRYVTVEELNLSPGEHTVMVTNNTTGYMTVDCFDIGDTDTVKLVNKSAVVVPKSRLGQQLWWCDYGWLYMRADDASLSTAFSGSGWSAVTGSGVTTFERSGKVTKTLNDSVSFNFTGTRIRILDHIYPTTQTVNPRSTDPTAISVLLDGQPYSYCTGDATRNDAGVVVFEALDLPDGEHSIKLVNTKATGTNGFGIDQIQIDNGCKFKPYDTSVGVRNVLLTAMSPLDLKSMVPGKRVGAKYEYTAAAVGKITEIYSDIVTPSDTGTVKLFNMTFVGYAPNGDYKFIPEENLQVGISWETINGAGLATMQPRFFYSEASGCWDFFNGVMWRLPQSSADLPSSEWDAIIVNGPVSPNDATYWHTSVPSWTVATPSSADSAGVAAAPTLRVTRGGATPATSGNIVSTTVAATAGFRPVIFVQAEPGTLHRGKKSTCPLLFVDKFDDIAPGRAIKVGYTSYSFGQTGFFPVSGQGCANMDILDDYCNPCPDGYVNMICVGYAPNGYKKLVADRVIQTGLSWETLNSAGYCTASGVTMNISEKSGIVTRIFHTTELAQVGTADGTYGEWDAIISRCNINGMITPSDNAIWNAQETLSWTFVTGVGYTTRRYMRGIQNATTIPTGQAQAESTYTADNLGFRPVMLVPPPAGQADPAPVCNLKKVKGLHFTSPGMAVPCRYTAKKAGVIGSFAQLGTSKAPDISDKPGDTPDGTFYWVHVGYAPGGQMKFVADRNLQGNISWETLNAAGLCTFSGMDASYFTGADPGKSVIRLMQSHWSNPSCDAGSSEWEAIMKNPTVGNSAIPGGTAVWNTVKSRSWTISTPSVADVVGTPAVPTARVARGSELDTGVIITKCIFDSNAVFPGVCFRPVLIIDADPQNCNIIGQFKATNKIGSRDYSCTFDPQIDGVTLEGAYAYVTVNGVLVTPEKTFLNTWDYNVSISTDKFKIGANTVIVYGVMNGVVSKKKYTTVVKESHVDPKLFRYFREYDGGYTYQGPIVQDNTSLVAMGETGYSTSGYAVMQIENSTAFDCTHRTGINGFTVDGPADALFAINFGDTGFSSWDPLGASVIAADMQNPTQSTWMTKATFESLKYADWANMFKQSSVKVAIAMKKGGVLNSVILDTPPNVAPTIVSLGLKGGGTTVHGTQAQLEAVVTDPEGDSFQYRLYVNGKLYSDWGDRVDTPALLDDVIDADFLNAQPATNTIKLEVEDTVGNLSSATTTISTINNKPVISMVTSNTRDFSATISDPDGDDVSYTLILLDSLGHEIARDHRDGCKTPYILDYKPADGLLISGNSYSYSLIVDDNQHKNNSIVSGKYSFKATPYGIIFYEGATDAQLTDENSLAITGYSLGATYLGKWTPDIKWLRFRNHGDYPITDIVIHARVYDVAPVGSASPFGRERTDKIHMYFSDDEPFTAGLLEELPLGGLIMNPGDAREFYTQGEIDMDAVAGDKIVRIFVQARAIR